MKIVGFLGGYDKTDLLLYMAKILSATNRRVILIDTTIMQKTRYIVPAVNPSGEYVTEFEGFDVAVGFRNMDSIKGYLGGLDYDIALVDIDTPEMFQEFNADENYKNCFVTAFDLYSLKKGLEVLSVCTVPNKIVKVLFSKNMSKGENEYLDYLALGYKIEWDENIINFPIELGNYSVTVERQMVSRIKLRGLSTHYKESLQYLIEIIFDEEISSKELTKIIRNLEREL